MKRTVALSSFLAAAGVFAGLGGAASAPWFHLASRAVYCHVDQSSPQNPLICWRPANGYTVSMIPRGVVHVVTTREFRRYWEDSSPKLAKGHSWRYPGYVCKARSDGRQLTCTNLKHHGWSLGPAKAKRVF